MQTADKFLSILEEQKIITQQTANQIRNQFIEELDPLSQMPAKKLASHLVQKGVISSSIANAILVSVGSQTPLVPPKINGLNDVVDFTTISKPFVQTAPPVQSIQVVTLARSSKKNPGASPNIPVPPAIRSVPLPPPIQLPLKSKSGSIPNSGSEMTEISMHEATLKSDGPKIPVARKVREKEIHANKRKWSETKLVRVGVPVSLVLGLTITAAIFAIMQIQKSIPHNLEVAFDHEQVIDNEQNTVADDSNHGIIASRHEIGVSETTRPVSNDDSQENIGNALQMLSQLTQSAGSAASVPNQKSETSPPLDDLDRIVMQLDRVQSSIPLPDIAGLTGSEMPASSDPDAVAQHLLNQYSGLAKLLPDQTGASTFGQPAISFPNLAPLVSANADNLSSAPLPQQLQSKSFGVFAKPNVSSLALPLMPIAPAFSVGAFFGGSYVDPVISKTVTDRAANSDSATPLHDPR